MRRDDLKALGFLGFFFGFVALIALAGWVVWFLLSTHRIQSPRLDRHAGGLWDGSVLAVASGRPAGLASNASQERITKRTLI